MLWNTDINDKDLMKRISAGDKKAFSVLMQRHLASLINFNKQYLVNEAEDISQEAFIRLWNNAENWQDKGISPKAWLFRVSYNLCMDTLRKHKMVSLDELDITVIDPAHTDEQLAIKQAHYRQQFQALNSLPEKQRSAITLCAYNGLSNKETAKVLNISVEALESLLARGRRKLRRLLLEPKD